MNTKKRTYFPFLLFPSLSWLLMFLVIPILIVVVLSVLHKGAFGKIEFILDISSYKRALEPIYLKILLRSLWLASFTTASCLLFSYPLAYLMARSSVGMKKILLGLVIVPFWTNFIVRIHALKLLIGDSGLINSSLLKMHLISQPLRMTDNHFGVCVGMLYNYLPFMVLPLFVALEKLDFTLLDAAYDLGANRLQSFIKVLLPLSMPGIVTGSMFVFIPAFGEFVIPDMLGGSQSMYVGSIITETFLRSRDWPFGSALSTFLVLMAMVAFLIVLSRGGDKGPNKGAKPW